MKLKDINPQNNQLKDFDPKKFYTMMVSNTNEN